MFQKRHFIIKISYLEIILYLINFLESLKKKKIDKKIFKLINKLIEKVTTAIELGTGHLSLKRKTKTLSPSEYQRILLVKYLSFKGSGSLFVF